jgi:hypothetical protein
VEVGEGLLAIVPEYYIGFRSPSQVALCQAHYGPNRHPGPKGRSILRMKVRTPISNTLKN